MARVLITGLTPQHVGSERRRLKLYCLQDAMADTYRTLGHQVDYRPARLDENPHQYDAVFVGFSNPMTRSARHLVSVLNMLGRTAGWWRESNVYLYMDAWEDSHLKALGAMVSGGPDNLRRLLRVFAPGTLNVEYGVEHAERLWAVLEAMTHRLPTTVLNFFPWGDHAKVSHPSLVDRVDVDPSPQYKNVMVAEWGQPGSKARRWLNATLHPASPWVKSLGLTWPVASIGHRASGQAQLKERDVLAFCTASWGVLSRPRAHAGSGWWRPRFINAAQAGCVLLATPEEVSPLGADTHDNPYMAAAAGPLWVEGLDNYSLNRLAEEQHDCLSMNTWVWSQWAEALEAMLHAGNSR